MPWPCVVPTVLLARKLDRHKSSVLDSAAWTSSESDGAAAMDVIRPAPPWQLLKAPSEPPSIGSGAADVWARGRRVHLLLSHNSSLCRNDGLLSGSLLSLRVHCGLSQVPKKKGRGGGEGGKGGSPTHKRRHSIDPKEESPGLAARPKGRRAARGAPSCATGSIASPLSFAGPRKVDDSVRQGFIIWCLPTADLLEPGRISISADIRTEPLAPPSSLARPVGTTRPSVGPSGSLPPRHHPDKSISQDAFQGASQCIKECGICKAPSGSVETLSPSQGCRGKGSPSAAWAWHCRSSRTPPTNRFGSRRGERDRSDLAGQTLGATTFVFAGFYRLWLPTLTSRELATPSEAL